jgi:hypothetical protein
MNTSAATSSVDLGDALGVLVNAFRHLQQQGRAANSDDLELFRERILDCGLELSASSTLLA